MIDPEKVTLHYSLYNDEELEPGRKPVSVIAIDSDDMDYVTEIVFRYSHDLRESL